MMILGMSLLDAAILGAVIAAVSPAVIVPKMIKLMDEKYGTNSGIPQLILAGASVDDVFVIVMFSTFTSLAQGKGASIMSFVNIPISIITGIIAGYLVGYILAKFFEKIHIRDTSKVIILLCMAFIMVTIEDKYSMIIPFASLIGVMCIGVLLFRMIGVFVCLLKTKLDMKERFFCMLAYTPKATVQAAIGGLPLAMGLS